MQNILNLLARAEKKSEAAQTNLRQIREALEAGRVETWEKTAWDATWLAATPEERRSMRDAALRAGVFWVCSCGFTRNPSNCKTCLDCGCAPEEPV
jgi:hypothetical protein